MMYATANFFVVIIMFSIIFLAYVFYHFIEFLAKKSSNLRRFYEKYFN